MLVYPRHIPPGLASALEDQFLCSTVDEALRNLAMWLLGLFEADDVILYFERGFHGGTRCDEHTFAGTGRLDVTIDHPNLLLTAWQASEESGVVEGELREELSARWQGRNLFIPLSSELIVTQASERPFFGYFGLFYKEEPNGLSATQQDYLRIFPELLSELTANFIREITSREEMLGFFAQNVKNHLLLTEALLQHMVADDGEVRARLVGKIERALKRMSLETETVLLADKEAAERFKIAPEFTSLNELVSEVASEMQPLFDIARIRLILDLDESIPHVHLDRALFTSVVLNLLDNAYKFSRRGQRVYVRTRNENRSVSLQVADNGIGVPEDQRKIIFLKHYKARNNEDTPGNGLGLYLVKRIVEAHQGDVFVARRPNAKTTFVVNLPLVPEGEHP